MWKAIRMHPWRLEIVPAAAFAVAVWSVYVYQTHVTHKWPNTGENGWISAMMPVGYIGIMVLLWIGQMGSNHKWVQAERRKRFHWGTVVLPSIMLTLWWIIYIMVQVSLWNEHPQTSIPRALDFGLFSVIIACGIGITVLLEWSRRYVERPEASEPALSEETTGASHYRELSIDWWLVLIAAIVLAESIWWYLHGGLLKDLMMFPVGVLVLASMSVRIVKVTSTTLTYQCGIPFRIAIADILSCVPAHHEPFIGFHDRRPKPFCVTDGRCIEITTKDGRICRLGALRPSHICQLVEKATSAD